MSEGSELHETAPEDLGRAGTKLWGDIVALKPLDALQLALLHEICRAKDRLDKLDELIRGDADTWMWLQLKSVTGRNEVWELKVDSALKEATAIANLMKQLLAALRLPDEVTGQRPQKHNGGAQTRPVGKKSGTVGTVSSLERARQARAT